ncbi:MAG: hypothetical protein K8S55_16135 [Phycisphaerae bacterium]|nr:hypothetical protein [Phycisphaerae bacterium]
MKKVPVILVIVAALLSCGGVKLKDDPPVAKPPKAGRLTGTISPANAVKTLTAVSRVTGKKYQPHSFDKKTGRFAFGKLPGDATYDICISTTDSRNIEGINLNFVDSRMLRLLAIRRKQLGLPAKKTQKPFTQADADAITKLIIAGGKKDFMDYRRVLYIRGKGPRATVLLELMRTTGFHKSRMDDQKSDIVWRVELWYFARRGGGWERLANVERILRRVRTKPHEWQAISVEYYPALSSYVDADGKSKPVNFKISPKPDATRGRPANTKIKLSTKPHIILPEEKRGSRPEAGDLRPATKPHVVPPAAKPPQPSNNR